MEQVDAAIIKLRTLEGQHAEFGAELLRADDGALFPMDILAVAVLNRSVCLLVGFCDLVDKRNFVSAAPLLRLQLDNLLRFHGAWLVGKPHDFATDVLRGTAVRHLEDQSGKQMTDRYLLEKIAIEHPTLKNVYEHTSGYVHLSEKHIFNSVHAGKEGLTLNMKIGATDSFVREETYLEAAQAFFHVTGVLFQYLQGWLVTKRGDGALCKH